MTRVVSTVGSAKWIMGMLVARASLIEDLETLVGTDSVTIFQDEIIVETDDVVGTVKKLVEERFEEFNREVSNLVSTEKPEKGERK